MNAVNAPSSSSADALGQSKKKDSFLTVESFVLYKPNHKTQSFELFPQPRGTHLVNGRVVVVLGDVPFPPNVPYPSGALTMLYGFRDSLEELQRYLRFARENDMSSIKVTFRVPVRSIILGTTDMDNLHTTDFLNLRRLQSGLTDIIVDKVNQRLVQEGKGVSFSKMSEACSRPDLVCDVIRAQEIYSHIKAVAYMIPDDSNSARGRQVASVFTDRVEEPTFRGDMPFDIVLPELG